MTRSDVGKGHPEYYQDLAQAITDRTPGAHLRQPVRQPGQPGGARGDHRPGDPGRRWTATSTPSWSASAPAARSPASAATFAKASPKTEMVLADPVGSVLAPLIETGKMGEAGSWAVEGIGEDFVPPNCDLSLVKKAYSITDKESFAAARELLRKEGILAGSSSGTLLAAALRYCREQSEPKRVVTLVCDSGAKYLSKVFNDAFIAQEGWLERKRTGTVRDVVINRFGEGAHDLRVAGRDRCASAFARMRAADVSQLPVIEDGRVVGLVDESDILDALRRRQDDRMTRVFNTAGARGDGDAPRDHRRRCSGHGAPAALRARPRAGRHGRRRLPRPRHPHRPHQLLPDRRAHDETATSSPSPRAASMPARRRTRPPAR